MYRLFKGLALSLMKAPTEPPDPPDGSHESVQIFRASPKFLTYRLLAYWLVVGLLWIGWWILVAVALAEQDEEPAIAAALVAPLLLTGQLIAYFVVRIDYDMRYYIVTDRALRVREGAVIVKEMTITHANVQNMRVVQGPLKRLFGIWNLKVDTAGGGGATGPHGESSSDSHSIQMAGIENAHEVRDVILSHLRKHGRGTGLGDLDEPAARTFASADLVAALGEVRDAGADLRRVAESLV
jgi:membrane protein YdbS with pleckstrin-like domain